MTIKFSTLLFVTFFIFSISLKSQCKETVTKESNVSISALPNETISQSFKTTCSGVLSYVKMTHLVTVADKTTTVSVEDEQGNVLASLDEQTVIAGENTYDFETQGVNLEANTTYIFRIKVIYGAAPMKLSGTNTDFYPKGNLFLNDKAYIGFDLVNWEVSLINGMGILDYLSEIKPYSIAPNPSKNGVFKVELRDNVKLNYKIFSVSGKKVLSGTLTDINNTINTKLSKGLYLLKFKINEKQFSEKLIIN